MNEKLIYISNNIKSYRAKMGYTQEKMAELLGVTRQTYNDYEINPEKVKLETFKKIAYILNCKLSDFFVESNVAISNINF